MTTIEVHGTPAPGRGRDDPDASTDAGQLNWEQVRESRKRIALTVKDTFGRDIGVAHVSAWDRMRLAGMLTPEEAGSRDFMMNSVLALSAHKIGEHYLGPIIHRHEFERRCQMLDDEGFAAVLRAWLELGWLKTAEPTDEEAEAEAKKEKDRLKNSSATQPSPTPRG